MTADQQRCEPQKGGKADAEADPGMPPEELHKLLEAARRAHEGRREIEAVGKLLDIESVAARGTPREAELVADLARTLDEELLDELPREPHDTDRISASPSSLRAAVPGTSMALPQLPLTWLTTNAWRPLELS